MTNQIKTTNFEIYFWFVKPHFSKIDKGKSEQKEIQVKLNQILGTPIKIFHKLNGAPYINCTKVKNISISHSSGYYAIFLANEKIGIDIQKFGSNLLRGKHYFINSSEERNLELNDLNLHLIWSTKEAIYKKYEGIFEDLKENVTISSIDFSNNIIIANKNVNKETVICKFETFQNFVLVWTKVCK